MARPNALAADEQKPLHEIGHPLAATTKDKRDAVACIPHQRRHDSVGMDAALIVMRRDIFKRPLDHKAAVRIGQNPLHLAVKPLTFPSQRLREISQRLSLDANHMLKAEHGIIAGI